MSRKARSRALLRNLRKQARRGNLSALERKQLLQQEKRFRKGRSGFRKGLGAGLGAGLGIAAAQFLTSPAFKQLLENKPSLSDLRDRLKKEGVPADAVEEVANTVQDADKDATPAEIVQEVEEQVAPAAEDAAPAEEGPAPARGVSDPAMDPSIFDRTPGADLRSDAETGEVSGTMMDPDTEFDPMMDPESAVVLDFGPDSVSGRPTRVQPRNLTGELLDELGQFDEDRVAQGEARPLPSIDPSVDPMNVDRGGMRGFDPGIEQRLAAARESMRLRDNERSSENMRERAETLERLRREGGFDPFTGEFVDSDRQQRIDAEFDEDFERSAFTDAERAAERENARLDAMDDAAALDAALGRLPVPNEGDFVVGDMGGVGQRPALTGPNNPVSRRVNVNDPGLRLPIEDIPMEPEFFPEEEAELLRSRNRRRRLPGVFGPPLRTSGPRVQAMGGKNPKMADLMKKVKAKYGIR